LYRIEECFCEEEGVFLGLAGVVGWFNGWWMPDCWWAGGNGEVGVDSGDGTLVIEVQTDPAGQAGSLQFTGVTTGTISSTGTLITANLTPGTYTSTQADPGPDFELTSVDCDDGGSGLQDAQGVAITMQAEPEI
jgi:hypothetical protein